MVLVSFRRIRPTGSAFTLPALLSLAALSLGVLTPQPGRSEVLYKLETRCSLRGGPPVACQVEAVNEGEATLYRHSIGAVVETIRVTSKPLRMARWQAGGKSWESLRTASARFSTNTICFNGRQLCVVNANYLNSVREEQPQTTAGRDLVRVHFGADGRINASCYDDGCGVVLK
ncbi:MAG: hypothetical protein VKI83_08485 [Synechococcaceae cyanobacterium]|nr:hypothetical protein [Synechococcaceae cyanobacterium]